MGSMVMVKDMHSNKEKSERALVGLTSLE